MRPGNKPKPKRKRKPKKKILEAANMGHRRCIVGRLNEKDYKKLTGEEYRDLSNSYNRESFQSRIIPKFVKTLFYQWLVSEGFVVSTEFGSDNYEYGYAESMTTYFLNIIVTWS